MLRLANGYEKEITDQMRLVFLDSEYKYYFVGYRFLDENFITQDSVHYVSVNDYGVVIGYFFTELSRDENDVKSVGVIRFIKDKEWDVMFSKDLGNFLIELTEVFRKIEFSVIIGNPIEKSYDKLVKRFGGRIVGTFTKTCRLKDGRYYDEKWYEIFPKKNE